ncbi:folate-binding protein YgfZ [Marinobacter sp. SS5-14b]|uniref:CAF17-like 4Fe-4S cluster assembly/insertion protein YgfZ n=1 Tax=Marinobacter sp. SS5-14b TaxID=3050456 RepID=UPI0026E04787|nr:folate-binding protein [Marinobacter sp. SS5-14b]
MSKEDKQPVSSAQPTGLVALNNRVMIRISGPGTDKFVQGQFTQHVDEVTRDQSLRAAACSPKGRAYCLTRLVRDGNDLLMDLDSPQAETTLSHFRKYLMLFRGTTMEALPSARIFGLVGEAAAIAVAGQGAKALARPGQVLQTHTSHLIRVEDTGEGIPRYEWWQPSEEPNIPSGLPEMSLNSWLASSISAGVPWLTPATQDTYVPQMLNLQHLQGVHFKKGCYTGQEVIARMHFLGQLKKSLFRLSFSNLDDAPTEGTRLLDRGNKVGEIVNAVLTQDRQGEMLAVIRHDAEMDSLSLDGSEDAMIRLEHLPYPVPEREQKTQADT